MQYYSYISQRKEIYCSSDITGVKAYISDDHLFTNTPSVWKVYKDIKQVYRSWSSPCAVRIVKQHEVSRYLAACRDERYFRRCLGNKAEAGIKWINPQTGIQWKYLNSIEAREKVLLKHKFLDLSFGQEIKSGNRATVKGDERKCMYICIIFFAVEPTAYIKENGTKNMAYPAQECTVRKMCSCLRRAFSIPMMFPRRTGARVGGSDLVGNRLGRQILQGRFFRMRKKLKKKKQNS